VVAFLWLGVTTVLPVIAGELGGLSLYGWAFTGFMLANMIAAVTLGQWADRVGAVRPFLTAFAVFIAGCAVAAAAPSWIVVLLARAAQGFGVGGVLTVVYLAVGRGYSERLRARMLAVVASCWTIPALAGPVLLGALADSAGWRAVFAVFIPLAVLVALPALPGLRGPGTGEPGSPRRVLATLALTVGVGSILVGLDSRTLAVLLPAVVVGTLITIPALRALLPAGTLTLRRGVPSAVVVRGLVSAGYYGSEAFFPLAMTSVFLFSTTGSGLALAVGAVSWVVGAWAQARVDERGGNPGRRRRIIVGFGLLTLGIGAIAANLAAPDALPAALAVVGWGIGGLGMGLVYPSVTTLALGQSTQQEQGATAGHLQLSETLSVALVTGLGGAIIALGRAHGWLPALALAAVFALTTLAALIGIGAGLRTLTARSTAGTRPVHADPGPPPAA
ncbi:MAG: MFS transporter, partial [Pseudonocardia sp.]